MSDANPEQIEQARDRQQERQLQNEGAAAGLADAGPAGTAFDREKAEYLETLIDDDIDPGTVRTLDNLLSRDFVLGYLKSADFEEIKWLARLEIRFELMEYPDRHSIMTGWRRAAAYDDLDERKRALTNETRSKLEQLAMAFIGRLSRSKGGEQLGHLERTTSRVETVSEDKDDDGSITEGWL